MNLIAAVGIVAVVIILVVIVLAELFVRRVEERGRDGL